MCKQPNIYYQRGLYTGEKQQTGNHGQMVPLFTDFHPLGAAVELLHRAQLLPAPKYPQRETVPEKKKKLKKKSSFRLLVSCLENLTLCLPEAFHLRVDQIVVQGQTFPFSTLLCFNQLL